MSAEKRPYGADYWRCLLDAAHSHGDPTSEGEVRPDGIHRRDFLRLSGASAALAGLGSGCFESPAEKILAYVDRPPEVVPGTGTPYATSLELEGFGTGVVVESREGRPVKIEGNPRHPASLGGAGIFEQAALLGLYDPYRSRGVSHGGRKASWQEFVSAVAPGSEPSETDGAGLRFLLEPTASPQLARLVEGLAKSRPGSRVHFHAPLHSTAPRAAMWMATGRRLQPLLDLSRASVVVSLDADLLGEGPFHLRHARAFATGRRLRRAGDTMNRLYVVEPAPTVTGDAADHRVRRRATDIPALAAALFCELARAQGVWPELASLLAPLAARESDTRLVQALARDLANRSGESLVVVGERQPTAVHALGYALNELLGSTGSTLGFVESHLLEAQDDGAGIASLADEMREGDVSTLVICGGNPVRDAPADLGFAKALASVERSVCLSPHAHDTARHCKWHIAELHPLESWGDTRALDGTASPVQPLIAPLWEGRSRADMLIAFSEDSRSAYQELRSAWGPESGESHWEEMLETGVVASSSGRPITPSVDGARLARAIAPLLPSLSPRASHRIEVLFRRDPKVHDGRFANNPWLQELPDPITKLTWDNAALLEPRTAERLGVRDGDFLALRRRGRAVEIPAMILPGQAEGSLLLSLGYGQGEDLPVARGVGTDVGPLRTGDAVAPDVEIARSQRGADRHVFASAQTHWSMEGRDIVREQTLDEFGEPVGVAYPLASLYEPPRPEGPQWGMSIDQTVCTGCSACVVACQAENNIPTVGPEGVLKSREMHWLRVDRYLGGSEEDPAAVNQVMLCQHCEMAPCEYVCPVEATVHSRDGLNEMVYNRCVGTRFCSNNCPYKVRRFNWFDFHGDVPEVRKLQFNPDVTVRARGVMEKCTYCVQRIRRAGIEARNADRALEDGDVVTACQQACPTQAISFGSVSDPQSEVSRAHRAPHAYSVLEELGTRPRTRYLARVRNRNPALEGET